MPVKHPLTYEKSEEAKRIYKQLKADVRDFEELDAEEIGLLALRYPRLFPCSGCGGS